MEPQLVLIMCLLDLSNFLIMQLCGGVLVTIVSND